MNSFILSAVCDIAKGFIAEQGWLL